MHKINVKMFRGGRGVKEKVGEMNFNMKFDLKEVLMLILEDENLVNNIIKECREDSDFMGDFLLNDELSCRIYNNGELVLVAG